MAGHDWPWQAMAGLARDVALSSDWNCVPLFLLVGKGPCKRFWQVLACVDTVAWVGTGPCKRCLAGAGLRGHGCVGGGGAVQAVFGECWRAWDGCLGGAGVV